MVTNQAQWIDTKCSLCGNLAHYRTYMYLSQSRDKYAPGMEFLCKSCKESVELPTKTVLLPTSCAAPHGWPRTINGRIELLGDDGSVVETHYLCSEHAWRWREGLGPEFEMTVQSISFNGQEQGIPRRFLR